MLKTQQQCVGSELNLEETQRVFWTSISGEVMPDPFAATTPGSAGTGVSSTSSKTSASDLPSEPPISFTVVCTPVLVSGGDRFSTELEFHFRKRAAGMGGGVRAMCSVKVEAHVWGIQSSIEPWMMAEAKRNLTAFFPFMSEFFRMNSKAAITPAVLEQDGEFPLATCTANIRYFAFTRSCSGFCAPLADHITLPPVTGPRPRKRSVQSLDPSIHG